MIRWARYLLAGSGTERRQQIADAFEVEVIELLPRALRGDTLR
jgi:hypothetical protein